MDAAPDLDLDVWRAIWYFSRDLSCSHWLVLGALLGAGGVQIVAGKADRDCRRITLTNPAGYYAVVADDNMIGGVSVVGTFNCEGQRNRRDFRIGAECRGPTCNRAALGDKLKQGFIRGV